MYWSKLRWLVLLQFKQRKGYQLILPVNSNHFCGQTKDFGHFADCISLLSLVSTKSILKTAGFEDLTEIVNFPSYIVILTFHTNSSFYKSLILCPCFYSIVLVLQIFKWPGPSCSKLIMLLVNVLFKLCSLNIAYMLIFCWNNVSSFCICKSYSLFSAKIPVNLNLYLLELLIFWPLMSLLSKRCFEQLDPDCIASRSNFLITRWCPLKKQSLDNQMGHTIPDDVPWRSNLQIIIWATPYQMMSLEEAIFR